MRLEALRRIGKRINEGTRMSSSGCEDNPQPPHPVLQRNDPVVSILLPMYNVGPYLTACLDSILSQSDARVEVIALDDCSTDNSLDIATKASVAHAGLFRVIPLSKNMGVSCARNRLLQEARGEYVWFVDPDDILNQGAVERLMTIISSHHPDLVICDFITLDETRPARSGGYKTRRRRSHLGGGGVFENAADKVVSGAILVDKLYVWNKVFRKAICSDELQFPAGRYFEDMNFAIGLAARSRKTVYTRDAWVTYRRRPGSILASMSGKKLDDWRHALQTMTSGLADIDDMHNDRVKLALSYCITKNYLEILTRLGRSGADKSLLLAVEREMKSTSPLRIHELVSQLARRGNFIHAYRIVKCCRRAPSASED